MDNGNITRTIKGPLWHTMVSVGGFLIASLVVFGSVAFFEQEFYKKLKLYGAYAAWTGMFVLIGGVFLTILTPGQRLRMFLSFAVGFIIYSITWTAAYFVLKGFVGELVGLVLGAFLMGACLAVGLQNISRGIQAGLILILANSGYYVGEAIWKGVGGQLGMILWGIPYGLLFGAGIGLAVWAIKK